LAGFDTIGYDCVDNFTVAYFLATLYFTAVAAGPALSNSFSWYHLVSLQCTPLLLPTPS